ncbi:hypothetical protein G3A_18715 [Bacillus sp. 17376]|uniref:MucB/RseB N-terminal domain-containing protein n=1 Tax=Mesobacillus boroniphilus JCM 21738 TaxID=1294265 RepID=W4RUX3_9BACI|nr:hypothetical protein [Mesobacillus boroniphilus]ESU31062.1 hypothetical protein G3A_18715 [Bacillus sp. 17376]GAE48106.1 hypothetical protein JCM21738_5184 [Mesobacillus boroniphilus JCM 21738]
MKKSKLLIGLFTASVLVTSIGVTTYKDEIVKANQLVEQSMSKEEIHTLMLNSIDNYKTVKGTFEYKSKAGNFDYEINYKVKTQGNPASKIKITSKDNNNDVHESLFVEGKLTEVTHKNKSFEETGVITGRFDKEKYKTPRDRYGKQNGEALFIRRQDPSFMNMAAASLFPQNVGLGYLENYNNWEITGNGNFLNLDVVIIEGKLNEYYQEKHQAENFKLWVHRDSGILLKLEEYSQDGTVVDFINTKKIKLNESLSDVDLNINIPKEYKKNKF